MDNGIGQSPCLVAANLGGACNSGSFYIYAIPINSWYALPKGDNLAPCECNTIYFNLVQACSYCQDGKQTFWSDWASYCPASDISKPFPYPVPDATEIPPWALPDPTLLGYWSYSHAFAYAESPSASITPYVTTSSSTASAIHLPIRSPTPTPLPEKKSSNTGDIVVGVVGGVAVLVFLVLGVWYLRSRSAANHQPPSGAWAIEQGKPHWEQQEPRSPVFVNDEVSVAATSPTAGAFVTPLPYQPYDPTDPAMLPQVHTPSPPRIAAPLPFNPTVTIPMTAEFPSTQRRLSSMGMSVFSEDPPSYVSRSGTIDHSRRTDFS